MLQTIRSLIKRCYVTSESQDNSTYPIANVSYLEKTTTVENLTPYGLYNNPPVDSTGIVFVIGGSEENRTAILNTPNLRFKNLKTGEVVIGNPVTQSNIKFSVNGDIEITGKNDLTFTITKDNTITISGNYSINAVGGISLTSAEDIQLTAPEIILGNGGAGSGLVKFSDLQTWANTHVHNDPVSGVTSPPTVAFPTAAQTNIVKGE